jgi:hypothetical protein
VGGSQALDDVGEAAVGDFDPELGLALHDGLARQPLVVGDRPGQRLDLAACRAGH